MALIGSQAHKGRVGRLVGAQHRVSSNSQWLGSEGSGSGRRDLAPVGGIWLGSEGSWPADLLEMALLHGGHQALPLGDLLLTEPELFLEELHLRTHRRAREGTGGHRRAQEGRAHSEELSAWSSVHGAQCMELSAWSSVHGAQWSVHGAQCVELSAWSSVHGALCMELSAWSSVRGALGVRRWSSRGQGTEIAPRRG